MRKADTCVRNSRDRAPATKSGSQKRSFQLPSFDFIGGPKSKKGRRTVPLDPDFSKALKEYWMAMPVKMKAEGWLFPTEKGTLSYINNWRNRILYKACDLAGLSKDERPTWHGLRHAYATALLNKRGAETMFGAWNSWVTRICPRP